MTKEHDLITDEELAMLETCDSESAWNAACDRIKAARQGRYPTDWWPRVMKSGMMAAIVARFGGDMSIRVQALPLPFDKDT